MLHHIFAYLCFQVNFNVIRHFNMGKVHQCGVYSAQDSFFFPGRKILYFFPHLFFQTIVFPLLEVKIGKMFSVYILNFFHFSPLLHMQNIHYTPLKSTKQLWHISIYKPEPRRLVTLPNSHNGVTNQTSWDQFLIIISSIHQEKERGGGVK